MNRRLLGLVLLLVGLLSLSSVAFAQDAEPIATGLNNPRHISFDADGNLYIAEAGQGGDTDGIGPFGAAKFGETGQITVVSAEGEQSVLIPNLLSLDAGFGQIEGPMAVYVTDDSYWVVVGIGPQELGEGQHVEALVQYDKETLEVGAVIDIGAYETENNPDQTEELVANPSDIDVSADGVVYIVDASGNALYSWTEADGLSEFAVWVPTEGSAQAVPTSVSVGPDGDVYVGFLSGFPFAKESAVIERYSADGELKETYTGLSYVTDVVVTDDGTIYAVEFAAGFGDFGWESGGRVVEVSADGVEAIAEGLNFPYGLAINADGEMFVSVNTYGITAEGALILDEGAVIPVGGM